ncbi:MAG: hypothetical protein ABF449_10565, partial [Ethanoligenens sp.]
YITNHQYFERHGFGFYVHNTQGVSFGSDRCLFEKCTATENKENSVKLLQYLLTNPAWVIIIKTERITW